MAAPRENDSQLAVYLFGDGDQASHRLRLLSEVFAESSRAFLRCSAPQRAKLAVDIGCGPGHSTRLVADELKPLRIVGIDSSEAFVEEARQVGGRDEQYLVHDITSVPFPVGPADILYGRFVATHLRDPLAVINGWASQLVKGGLLLLDEVESISTSSPLLSRYLDTLNALFISEGKALCVGPTLSKVRPRGPLEQRSNEIRRLRVQDRHAAAMFRLNLEAWRDHQFVADTYDDDKVRLLADDLEASANSSSTESSIEWVMRQIVLEKK